MDRSFSIISTRSIYNKVDEFLHNNIESKLGICFVTDTWLDGSNLKHRMIWSDLNIPSYTCIDVSLNPSAGETSILFIDTLKIKLIDFGLKDAFDDLLFELYFHSTTLHIESLSSPIIKSVSRVHNGFFDGFIPITSEIMCYRSDVIPLAVKWWEHTADREEDNIYCYI